MSELILPDTFDGDGLLPPGDYALTLDKLASSMLVHGPVNRDGHWNASWRRDLVRRLGQLVEHLSQAGIVQVYIDGSFATDKNYPGDIDGYFVCSRQQIQSRTLATELAVFDHLWLGQFGLLQPVRDPIDPRRSHRPMWARYRIDLLPHYGQGSGITDEHGNELQFPSAFRRTRDHKPKGIIRLLL